MQRFFRDAAKEDRIPWLRWLPPEVFLIAALVFLAPIAYGIYLVGQHHVAVGVALVAFWLIVFGAVSTWLHRRKYFHFGVAVACACGIIAASLLAVFAL